MIKAALLTPNFSLGGAERWILQLLAHVDPRRVQWTSLGISGHGGADPGLCAAAAKLTQLHTNRVPPARRSPKMHPFDPVDVHAWHPTFQQLVKTITRDADVVLTWGVPNMLHWFPGVSIPRICCSHTTIVESEPRHPITGLTHLAGCAEIAMRYFDDRPGQQDLPRQVIYNGCDREHLIQKLGRERQRDAWECTPRNRVVGHIGRQSPEKNYLSVARALPFLPREYRAVYYGRDQLNYFSPAAELLTLQRQWGSRLQCFMPQPGVGDILSGFDALVIASHHEACSLAMLEAWFSGTPVVATPVGSVPELQQKFGQLVIEVPPDPDGETLAAAIEEACGPAGRRVAAHALEVAQQQFTIETFGANWAAYLESVC